MIQLQVCSTLGTRGKYDGARHQTQAPMNQYWMASWQGLFVQAYMHAMTCLVTLSLGCSRKWTTGCTEREAIVAQPGIGEGRCPSLHSQCAAGWAFKTKTIGSGSNPFRTRSQGFGSLPNRERNQWSGPGQNPEPEPNFGVQTGPVRVRTEARNRTLPSLLHPHTPSFSAQYSLSLQLFLCHCISPSFQLPISSVVLDDPYFGHLCCLFITQMQITYALHVCVSFRCSSSE
jgi:hypothetical protein